MPLPFLLVLRFPPDSPLTSADIEDDIARALGNPRDDRNAGHIVDGNEIGHDVDIFVFTRDPAAAFELCRPLFRETNLLETVIAAARPVDGEHFEVLYPPDYRGDFRV